MIVTAALVLGVFSPVLHEAFRGVFDLPLAVALEGSAIVGLPAILVRIAYRFGALQMKMVSQRFATFRNPSVVMGGSWAAVGIDKAETVEKDAARLH